MRNRFTQEAYVHVCTDTSTWINKHDQFNSAVSSDTVSLPDYRGCRTWLEPRAGIQGFINEITIDFFFIFHITRYQWILHWLCPSVKSDHWDICTSSSHTHTHCVCLYFSHCRIVEIYSRRLQGNVCICSTDIFLFLSLPFLIYTPRVISSCSSFHITLFLLRISLLYLFPCLFS